MVCNADHATHSDLVLRKFGRNETGSSAENTSNGTWTGLICPTWQIKFLRWVRQINPTGKSLLIIRNGVKPLLQGSCAQCSSRFVESCTAARQARQLNADVSERLPPHPGSRFSLRSNREPTPPSRGG